MPHLAEFSYGGTKVTLETGKWAKQSHGAVVYRSGNLVLLATVCAEKDVKDGQDFFPLTVDYREKIYAVGRVPGGYFKRENRPAEHETLISRIIDRPIRPLFPEGYMAEVQLLVTVLSADEEITVEGHAVTAASAALMVSDIPFNGPIAGVVVARVDGKFIADPTQSQLKKSDLELVVAGSAESITMIEGGAQEYTRQEIIDAIAFAHENIRLKLAPQKELAEKAGVTKREVRLRTVPPELKKSIWDNFKSKMASANKNSDKAKRSEEIESVYKEALEFYRQEYLKEDKDFEKDAKFIRDLLHELESDVVRNRLFEEGVRYDGRRPDEIREISVELDVLPGVHGSAVFTRGQTQSLGVVTLGTANDYQRYENLAGQQIKHFMLHYNFPPFSTGEVKRAAGPGRREIGHGNLAERSLKYVVPSPEKFPYTIRVVSEILESNGSSSMASVCSGSLAMMAAGVPVTGAVSGIAMGLIMHENGRDFKILSDIAGIEDHFGDMDFKVAGTEKGITGFQLDIKLHGVSIEILDKALEAAEAGRLHILKKMNEAISRPREAVADNAPRILTMKIDPDRIGELIGPGGKVIRAIIEKSGAELNVEDNGTVTISSSNKKSNELAMRMVNEIFQEIEPGTRYTGVVKRVADFGAIIEISPGKEGLMHISKMSSVRVTDPHELVKEGDTIECIVIDVDRTGRIDLAHKDFDLSSFAGGGRPPRRGTTGGGSGGRSSRR